MQAAQQICVGLLRAVRTLEHLDNAGRVLRVVVLPRNPHVRRVGKAGERIVVLHQIPAVLIEFVKALAVQGVLRVVPVLDDPGQPCALAHVAAEGVFDRLRRRIDRAVAGIGHVKVNSVALALRQGRLIARVVAPQHHAAPVGLHLNSAPARGARVDQQARAVLQQVIEEPEVVYHILVLDHADPVLALAFFPVFHQAGEIAVLPVYADAVALNLLDDVLAQKLQRLVVGQVEHVLGEQIFLAL